MIDPIGSTNKYVPEAKKETLYLPHPSEFTLPQTPTAKSSTHKTTLPKFEILDQAQELSKTFQDTACATVEILLLGSSLSLPPFKEDRSKLQEAQKVLTQQVLCCIANALTRKRT